MDIEIPFINLWRPCQVYNGIVIPRRRLLIRGPLHQSRSRNKSSSQSYIIPTVTHHYQCLRPRFEFADVTSAFKYFSVNIIFIYIYIYIYIYDGLSSSSFLAWSSIAQSVCQRAFSLLAMWCLTPGSNPAFSRGTQLVSFRFEYRLPVPEHRN